MKHAIFLLGLFVIGCSGKEVVKTDPGKSPASDTPPAVTKTASDTEKKADTPAPAASAARVTCKQGSDERIIETVPKGAGCELNYSKFGETAAVATSVSGTSHCEAVQSRMKQNLEKSGFTCS